MQLLRLNSISPRQMKIAGWIAAGMLFYTLFGFLILPAIVRMVAVKQLSKQLNRTVTIQKVQLNPYTLTATIRGLVIQEKEGGQLLSWDEVYANFQLASLFRKAWVFKEVRLSQPFVRVQVNKDYTLNFSDIVEKFSRDAASKAKASGQNRALRINRLRLVGARASLTDLTSRVPFHRTIGPLEMTMTDFRTDSDNKNSYAFSGVTDGGEQFSWKGFFYLDPLRSEGEFSLDGLSLTKYGPLYQDVLRFEIKDGMVNLHATYGYELSAATNLLTLTNASFALRSFKVMEKGIDEPLAEISSFGVSGASVDVMARRAEIESMTLTDGRFALRRDKNAAINVIELSKPADASPNAPGGILLLLRAMTNVVAMLLNTTNLSTGSIGELNATNCSLRIEDLVNSQPVRMGIQEISVNAKNISNRSGTNMTAKISMRWETNGAIRADIKAGLSPPTAEVKLVLEKLNLRPLGPYLERYLDIFFLGSKLGLAGTVVLRSPDKDKLPEVRFNGELSLDEFSTAEGVPTDDLLKWKALRISGLEANLNPPVVSAIELRLEDLSARLIIETNQTVNLLSALRRGGTKAPAPSPTLTNLGIATVTEHPKLSIGSVVLTNASVQFTDRSLQPDVSLTFHQLSGAISGVSSDQLRPADVRFEGTIDTTARAEITGKMNPWNPRQFTDLKVTLKSVNLIPANPYSGKFLGYHLRKGNLSMDASYHIAEGTLESRNRITLEQFTLGEKVASAEATTLPVRLGISILKDRNGRIDLEVPINGSLDDPRFHLGNVISRALGNVFTKIVSSPFAALGALFGGKGEELSFQEFQAGATNLAEIEKLDTLVKGLYERPELQLEIEGNADAETDGDALRREKLRKQFQMQKWKSLLKAEQSRRRPDQVELTQPEYDEFLRGAYAQASPPKILVEQPTQHESPAPTHSTPRVTQPTARSIALPLEKGATALMRKVAPLSSEPSWQLDMERAVATITPLELSTLATTRAQNVKDYILQTGKVEGSRISAAEVKPGAASKGSRVYLRLQ